MLGIAVKLDSHGNSGQEQEGNVCRPLACRLMCLKSEPVPPILGMPWAGTSISAWMSLGMASGDIAGRRWRSPAAGIIGRQVCRGVCHRIQGFGQGGTLRGGGSVGRYSGPRWPQPHRAAVLAARTMS
jgi:hypothetical protein